MTVPRDCSTVCNVPHRRYLHARDGIDQDAATKVIPIDPILSIALLDPQYTASKTPTETLHFDCNARSLDGCPKPVSLCRSTRACLPRFLSSISTPLRRARRPSTSLFRGLFLPTIPLTLDRHLSVVTKLRSRGTHEPQPERPPGPVVDKVEPYISAYYTRNNP